MAKSPRSSSDRDGASRTEEVRGSVHPAVIRAAIAVSAWFVIAMAISFSGPTEADYLMGVVIGFSVIFFTLVLGLAAHAASRRGGQDPAKGLGEFLTEEVAVDTGSISGREALVQLLTLPIALAVGATIIGFIFVLSG